MALGEFGYRPYEGPRLASHHATWVLFRHAFRSGWSAWIVRVAVIASWIPPLLVSAWLGLEYWLRGQAAQRSAPEVFDAARVLGILTHWQLWLFVFAVGLGLGAVSIAEDLRSRAFQFYFSKPLTPGQYLLARSAAVAAWCWIVLGPPLIWVWLILVGTAPAEQTWMRLALLLPVLAVSGLLASMVALTSVGISALSPSPRLSMGVWLLFFVLPHLLALALQHFTGVETWRALSLPATLTSLSDLCFDPHKHLSWPFPLALFTVAAAAIAVAWARLHDVEVVT